MKCHVKCFGDVQEGNWSLSSDWMLEEATLSTDGKKQGSGPTREGWEKDLPQGSPFQYTFMATTKNFLA